VKYFSIRLLNVANVYLILLKGERKGMKIKRIVAFRVIALLMLTALITIPMVPASASSTITHYRCVGDSNRDLSICTYPTDAQVLNKTVYYGGDQWYDINFSAPVGNVVSMTVPKESYHSDPFFLDRLGPGGPAMWMQVRLVQDGNGSLGITNGALSDVNMNITVTGNGAGGFTQSIVRWGGAAPAGSAILSMPLNNTVWLGTSETDSTKKADLLEMSFPMITTTGTINVKIVDTAGPWPGGSVSMNGYQKTLTGVPFDSSRRTATLAGGGAGLDIHAYVAGVGDIYTDYIFVDAEILDASAVGGTWIPVDKLALLAPYIGLASAIILAVAAIAVFKYRKKQ
jgi:hypothetical protein